MRRHNALTLSADDVSCGHLGRRLWIDARGNERGLLESVVKQMTSTRPGYRLLRAVCLTVFAWLPATGCGESETRNLSPLAGTVTLRPGDTLLEHCDGARLLRIPSHSLLPKVAALLREDVRVEAVMPPLAWKRAKSIPREMAAFFATQDLRDLWWARPPFPIVNGAADPVVRVRGSPVPPWSFADGGPMPADYTRWFRGRSMVLAVSEGPPEQVSLVGTVSAVSEFARMERGRALHGHDATASEMRTRAALGDIKRSALLLPAPATLEMPAARLQADRLHVAVGIASDAWSVEDGIVVRRGRRSDGALFAVEIVEHEPPGERHGAMRASEPVRVWSATLEAEDVGTRWLEAVIDLSRWRDKTISIRLVTEPGAQGDAVHDYTLWADLRLRGSPAASPTRPHVVFIIIDTLRADRLAAYGARRATTPGLDGWAARHAVAYTDSVSTAPWTLPSTVSLLTGLAVHQHGVDQTSDAMGDGAATLAARLAEAGYETRALTAGGYLRPVYGFDAGFEYYETREPKDLDWSGALNFVRERDSERPFFLFLHTYFVHAPYAFDARWVHPDYGGALRQIDVDTGTVFEPWMRGEMYLDEADGAYVEALYDGLVSHMDEAVTEFLSELEALVQEDDLMVVLTSDHGEAFLEHGHLGHGTSLYDEQLRVPLFVRYPDGQAGTSAVPVSGIDLVPTILDSIGLPVPTELPGRSLRGRKAETRGVVRLAQSGAALRAVFSGGMKLIDSLAPPDTAELYELTTDARELHDLAASRPDQVNAMRRRLTWFLDAHPATEGGLAIENAASNAVLDELRALGYVGDG